MDSGPSSADRKISLPIGLVSALACLLIVIVRGGNPVAIKVVLLSLSPMQAALSRVLIACVGVGVFAVSRGVDLRPRQGELVPLALLSFAYALQIGAIQAGADYTSPVLVAVLFNTYPIIGNLLSSLVVPEDRLNLRRVAGLIVAFSGVVWIFQSRMESALAQDPLLGNSLVLFGATLLATRTVYVRQLVLRIDYVKAVFWPMMGSLPLFLLGGAVLPDGAPRTDADWTVWLALLFQGIVVGGVGQLAWVYLIRRHTPGTVIAFSFLTPISGLVLTSLYFQEPVPSTLLLGFSAVLGGIAVAARRATPGPSRERPAPPRGFGGSA